MTKRSLFDNSLTLTILFGFSWVNRKGGGSGRVAFSGVLALKGAKSAGLFKLMSGYKMRRFFFAGLASGLSDSVFSSFCVFSLMQALEHLKLLISSSHFLRFSLIFLYFSTLLRQALHKKPSLWCGIFNNFNSSSNQLHEVLFPYMASMSVAFKMGCRHTSHFIFAALKTRSQKPRLKSSLVTFSAGKA